MKKPRKEEHMQRVKGVEMAIFYEIRKKCTIVACYYCDILPLKVILSIGYNVVTKSNNELLRLLFLLSERQKFNE